MAHEFNQVISNEYIRTETADYTILATDNESIFIYTGDDSGGNSTVVFTLPAVGAVPVGRRYTIVNKSSNATTTTAEDHLEIQDSGGSVLFVLGKLSTTPEDRFNSITLVNDGTTWLSTSDYNFPKVKFTITAAIDPDDPSDIIVYNGNLGGASTFTYTLPANGLVHVGRKYTFINKSANVAVSSYDRVRINNSAATEIVTITNSRTAAGEPYGTVTVVNDGTDWLTSAGISIV